MSTKKNWERPIGIAAVIGVVLYFVISAGLKMSCGNNYFLEPRIAIGATSFLVAAAGSFAAFVMAVAIDADGHTDKFEKICSILAAAIAVLWLAYVFVDNRICIPNAWREYITLLITPMLLLSIGIIGRRWMKAPDA